jgi:hypothetical protein
MEASVGGNSIAVDEPILILALPRSGSSMTAGIFAQHGVWTGRCRPGAHRNPKGFFEGLAIKKALMKMQRSIVHDGVLAQQKPGFRELVHGLILEDGYSGGPWLWKGSALYWPAWFEFTPKIVVCRRDPEATFRSCRAAPKVFGSTLTDKRLREVIAIHHGIIDELIADHGAFEVHTEAVAHGDFSSIAAAVVGCGLEFDAHVTDEFVDESLWHYGSKKSQPR